MATFGWLTITFNSLSRDHVLGPKEIKEVEIEDFQLPLSGSHHQSNSGNRDYYVEGAFNSLSRDHSRAERAR